MQEEKENNNKQETATTARALRNSLKATQSGEAHIRLFNMLGADLFHAGLHENTTQQLLIQLCALLVADHGLIATEGMGVLTVIASKGNALPIGARIPMLGNIANLLKSPVQFNVLHTQGARVWTYGNQENMREWLLPIAFQQKSVGLMALSGAQLMANENDEQVLLSICGLLALAMQPKSSKIVGIADTTILENLTPREREIFALLPSGMSNIELAEKLGIAPGTVKIHVERVFSKLNVRDRTQAAIKAVEMGYKSGH